MASVVTTWKVLHQKILFTNVVGCIIVDSLMLVHDGQQQAVSRKKIHSSFWQVMDTRHVSVLSVN